MYAKDQALAYLFLPRNDGFPRKWSFSIYETQGPS